MNSAGIQARAPGRDGMFDTGLFEYNREDMTVEAMEANMHRWAPDDLFAIFRDELGGTHAQYSHFDDFSQVAVNQLLRTQRGFEDVHVDRETILYLVAILMISRVHGYQFDNFVELRDYRNRQIFDFRGLCEWIANNEDMFMTEAEVAADLDDASVDSLRSELHAMPATV